MQKLIVVGNLTGDPQSRVTSSGKNVCGFTVAVNRRHKPDETDFFRVTVWDKLAELCQSCLSKGKKVGVIGTVSVSTYTAKDGSVRATLEMNADEVEFLTPKEKKATEKGYEEVNGEELPWG